MMDKISSSTEPYKLVAALVIRAMETVGIPLRCVALFSDQSVAIIDVDAEGKIDPVYEIRGNFELPACLGFCGPRGIVSGSISPDQNFELAPTDWVHWSNLAPAGSTCDPQF